MPRESKSEQTPASLRLISEQLIRIGGNLAAYAEFMDQAKIESMLVNNFVGLTDGMSGFVAFQKAVEDAYLAVKKDRNEFGTPQPNKTDGAPRPTKKKGRK